MYHETDTNTYSFNYIVGKDNAGENIQYQFNTKIDLTGTTGTVKLSDDNNELKSQLGSSTSFTGTHKYIKNTDGGVITLTDDTFTIDFSVLSATDSNLAIYFANPSNSKAVLLSQGVSYKIQAVPVPAAIWMLGSGLTGLFVLRRRASK